MSPKRAIRIRDADFSDSIIACWQRSKEFCNTIPRKRTTRTNGMIGLCPLSPVGRMKINPRSGLRAYPAVEDPAARKRECIGAYIIDDSKLKISIEWRTRYWVPA